MLDEETRQLLEERNFQALFEKGPDVWNEATNDENLTGYGGNLRINLARAEAVVSDYIFSRTIKFENKKQNQIINGCHFEESILFVGCDFIDISDISKNFFSYGIMMLKCNFLGLCIDSLPAREIHVEDSIVNDLWAFKDVASERSGEKEYCCISFARSKIEQIGFEGASIGNKVKILDNVDGCKNLVIRDCKLQNLLNISDMKVDGIFDFQKNIVNVNPLFYGIEVSGVFGGVSGNRIDASPEESAVETYRFLRSLASLHQDYQAEMNFSAVEMRCMRRGRLQKGGIENIFLVVVSLVYEFSSEFGQSVARPFIIMVGLVLVSAAGISAFGASDQNFAYGFIVAVASALPFVGQSRFGFQNAIERLCAVSPGSADLDPSCANWVYGISVVEGLLSLILIFLIGLGLRNQFRIK